MARAGLGEGWACLFANDFDPLKARTYRANWPGEPLVEGDVWAIAPSLLPGRADLAWASSPCQDFSLAGPRAGLAGGRSSAFFGFWRLIEALAAEDRAPQLITERRVRNAAADVVRVAAELNRDWIDVKHGLFSWLSAPTCSGTSLSSPRVAGVLNPSFREMRKLPERSRRSEATRRARAPKAGLNAPSPRAR